MLRVSVVPAFDPLFRTSVAQLHPPRRFFECRHRFVLPLERATEIRYVWLMFACPSHFRTVGMGRPLEPSRARFPPEVVEVQTDGAERRLGSGSDGPVNFFASPFAAS